MQSSLLLGLQTFGIYLFLILLALRLVRRCSPAVLVCGFSLLTYLAAFVIILIQGWQVYFFIFSSTYWFLSLALLMIFGAVYKSISLKMMLNLLNKPQKTDLYDAILVNDIRGQSYLYRVEILAEKKLIGKADDSTYRLTDTGRSFAKKLWLLQKIFSIMDSG